MSGILQLAVGLIFVYSLMAILVTQVNTMITRYFNLRAKNLRDSIQSLITDRRLLAEVLTHPLIKMVDAEKGGQLSLEVRDNSDATAIIDKAKLNRVDYIAPATFVESLVGLLMVRAEGAIQDILELLSDGELRRSVELQMRTIIAAPSDDKIDALGQTLAGAVLDEKQRKDADKFYHIVDKSFSGIRTRSADLMPLLMGVETINLPILREALRMVIFTANDAAEAVRKLEAWFDDGMNRASSLFRERLQRYSLIGAFALVVLLNVDTLAMVRSFWIDPSLREAVAVAAEDFIQTVPDEDEQAAAPTPTPSVLDPNATPVPPEAATDEAAVEEFEQSVEDVRATVDQLLRLNVPIGWTWQPADCTSTADDQIRLCESANNLWNFFDTTNPDLFTLWLGKIVGLVVSAIAAAQGAPFWFDLLRKLTSR